MSSPLPSADAADTGQGRKVTDIQQTLEAAKDTDMITSVRRGGTCSQKRRGRDMEEEKGEGERT